MNEPYITVSEDLHYAFVEYSGAIATRAQALTELDRYLDRGLAPRDTARRRCTRPHPDPAAFGDAEQDRSERQVAELRAELDACDQGIV